MDDQSKKSGKVETTSSEIKKSEIGEAKSKLRTRSEAAELKNLEEEKQTLEQIETLAVDLLNAADVATRKSESSVLRQNISELQSAINTLRAASVSPVLSDYNSTKTSPVEIPVTKHGDCGCGGGCGPKEKKCCVEIYGSGVRVIKASDGPVQTLELILAIQAGGVKAVFPGLTSFIQVHQKVGWVKVDWPITKICVPCDKEMSIPLTIEAMDMDLIASVPEKGSTTGAIAVSCNCNICSKVFEIKLAAGSIHPGEKKGEIMVEVSARRVNGECCC